MDYIKELKYFFKDISAIRKFYFYLDNLRTKRLAIRFEKKANNWPFYQKFFLYELLSYAKKHSSYYSKIISGIVTKDNCVQCLKHMPLLTKELIIEQGINIYSDKVIPDKQRWANTGGSTGEPLRFPILYSNHWMENICQMILYRSMGVDGLNDLIVSIDGSRIDQSSINNNVFWKKEPTNFPYGKFSLSTLYMSDLTLPYYIDFLNTIKPKAMRGYPSGFMELATYCKKNKVSFNYKLKGIYLTSENFGSEEESLISEIFDCPVWGQYGHTEASIFAVKKPHSENYICSPIYGYTEILSEEGTHVKEGEVGEIVVTGFNHYGMPFIRYKTGDLAEYGGTLQNGSVVLNKLLGRSIDYVINWEDEKVFLVGFIFGGHLKAFNHIRQWQLEQHEKGIVSMKISKADGYNEVIENEIVNLFESKQISVNIQYTSNFERTKRGKFKFLIQHIK